ncbi:acyl-CoA:lysophosphatidylglycerol acyltransferase 1-like protein [Leptotrombidium deliense]|uniref:Acyl-CoA:lysophosphatidylglycerol acyltransferase 1-like protein n=1 Tax=Leptotrombidium deliense TaxID=299467 RepID=A0A443SCR8_9ACAR|nr:acyl-CoA:lysophosphatidylglycerol acyltransferase 1-like protein [Leptotrombidium deliense]
MSSTTTVNTSYTERLRSVFSYVKQAIRLTIIIVHNLYHIPAYLLITWILLLPLYHFNRPLYWIIENHLYNWCLYTVGSWSWLNRVSLKKENGNINNNLKSQTNDNKPKLLLISNHQSTSDVPLMMRSFVSHCKYKLLWIMEDIFKYTNFGVVSLTHGDYFLRVREYQKQHLTKYCLREQSKYKDLIILFPEGGFRYKRLESSHRYASTKGKQQLFNVTWPRTGAFNDINVDQLQLTHVIDLTIIYPEIDSPLSVFDICCGQRDKIVNVYFYYRIYERNQTLNDDWLHEVFQQKETIMQQFYLNPKQFLEKNSKFTRIVNLNWFKLIAIHLFYILCTYFFIVLFKFIFTLLNTLIVFVI